jgi:hypothetical protein
MHEVNNRHTQALLCHRRTLIYREKYQETNRIAARRLTDLYQCDLVASGLIRSKRNVDGVQLIHSGMVATRRSVIYPTYLQLCDVDMGTKRSNCLRLM